MHHPKLPRNKLTILTPRLKRRKAKKMTNFKKQVNIYIKSKKKNLQKYLKLRQK